MIPEFLKDYEVELEKYKGEFVKVEAQSLYAKRRILGLIDVSQL